MCVQRDVTVRVLLLGFIGLRCQSEKVESVQMEGEIIKGDMLFRVSRTHLRTQ